MYTLSLSGHNYNLIAGKKNEFWLNEIARIMQLQFKPVKNSFKLLYFRNPQIFKFFHGAKKEFESLGLKYFSTSTNAMLIDLGKEADKRNEYLKFKHSFYPLFEKVILSGGFPVHGGLIDNGCILAGNSGSGKSTCCRRSPWSALCDDTSLIIKTKSGYLAHPWPSWGDYIQRNMNTTFPVEKSIPLKALFIVQKEKINKAIPLKISESVLQIYNFALQRIHVEINQIDKRRALKIKTQLFKNIWKLLEIIPAFTLKATLQGKFWKEMEGVL